MTKFKHINNLGFSKKIIIILCSVLGIAVLFAILSIWGLANLSKNGGLSNFKGDHVLTNAELIQSAIENIKKSIALPLKIDTLTTLEDVTSGSNAIRYHYVLDGVNIDKISNTVLKQHVVSGVCSDSNTKFILNKDVNLEYSYTVKNSPKTYFLVVTKNDCA